MQFQRRAFDTAINNLDAEERERLCMRVRTEGIGTVVSDMLSNGGPGHPDIAAAAVLDSCR